MPCFFLYVRHDNLGQCVVFVAILWLGEDLRKARQQAIKSKTIFDRFLAAAGIDNTFG
jgi:hypothetical protein